MKKKIFALLMAMVLVLGMSTTALAAVGSDWLTNPFYNSPYYDNTPEIGDFVWAGIAYEFNNEDKTSCSVVGLCKENVWEIITIPADVNGIAVTGIVDAFKDNSIVTRVQIPATVTFIDEFSFYNCSNLAEVVYNGVTYNEVSKFVVAYSANGGSFGSPNPAGYEFAGTKLAGAEETLESVEVKEIDVTWSKTAPWTVEMDYVTPDGEDWYYDVVLCKDGRNVAWPIVHVSDDGKCFADVSEYVGQNGEGKYTVKVTVGYYDTVRESFISRYEGVSAVCTYVKPAKQLEVPANFSFDKETGEVSFDKVVGAERYDVWMWIHCSGQVSYKECIEKVYAEDVTEEKIKLAVEWIVNDLEMINADEYYKSMDFSYSIGVIAISADINETAYSDYAKLVLFENKLTTEQAKEKFDEAFEKVEENPGQALNALNEVSNDTITEMLKTDAEFVKQVKKLDEVLIEDLGDAYKGTTSKTDVVDASKVEVVGLAINAIGTESVELTFAKPDKEVTVPEEYKKGVQLDISLLIDENTVEELAVPVTITMPIPAGVEKENLVILHYHGTATTPDVIVPTVNTDGTMTFIVSGFSTFVVTNEVDDTTAETPAPEAPKTGDASTTTFVCSLLLLAAGVVLVSKRNSFVK